MPLCYGGGLSNIKDVKKAIRFGAEKVSFNFNLFKNKIISKTAEIFGNQSIIASIDIIRINNNYFIYNYFNGTHKRIFYLDFINKVVDSGVGEIFINSVNKDGSKSGFDTNLFNTITEKVNIPVIGCGGAGNLDDFVSCYNKTNLSGIAAKYFNFFEQVLIKAFK